MSKDAQQKRSVRNHLGEWAGPIADYFWFLAEETHWRRIYL